MFASTDHPATEALDTNMALNYWSKGVNAQQHWMDMRSARPTALAAEFGMKSKACLALWLHEGGREGGTSVWRKAWTDHRPGPTVCICCFHCCSLECDSQWKAVSPPLSSKEKQAMLWHTILAVIRRFVLQALVAMGGARSSAQS